MSDTLIAIRVGTPQWLDEEVFMRFLAFLDSQPGAVDEIAFFTSATHPPLPFPEVERRCQRLKKILPQVRERGYRAGINVLATMGHHEENLPNSLSEPWQRVMDPEGRVSLGSFCPGSADLLRYVDRLYTLVAQTGPDFIWIDDDVRLLGHLPVGATCFCDDCIARFNREEKASFTRESLVTILQCSPSAERNDWRDRWLEHNRNLIRGLLRTAEQAVHRVVPTIKIGFMTGDRFYEGYAFAHWADALEGEQSGPARWRPGGGFYTDDAYMGLVEKAHDIGRQVSQLPPKVTIIQSEIENFPYHKLRKSVEITVLEAAAHMAAGATGIAFNILSQHSDPLDEYAPFLHRIAEVRPFYQALRDATGRGIALGVWPAWNRDIFADNEVADDWFRNNQSMAALRRPYVLAELGLPIAYSFKGASVTALSGPLVAAFGVDELESIFRRGVLMDVGTLKTLERLGRDTWAGVRVADTIKRDATEVLTEHPLNAPYPRWARDCRQSFWPQPAYRLEPMKPGVEVLARMVDYGGRDLGPCMTTFENPLGGRVVVMGYYPWMLIHNLAKSSQLKAVCRWLSRDELPVMVETYARVVVWAREGIKGNPVLIVLNASLDPVPQLVLKVRTGALRATYLSLNSERNVLAAVPDGPHHVRVTLRPVAPWSMHLLLF